MEGFSKLEHTILVGDFEIGVYWIWVVMNTYHDGYVGMGGRLGRDTGAGGQVDV